MAHRSHQRPKRQHGLGQLVKSGWSRKFDEPILLPPPKGVRQGRKLVTLEDACQYITKLPKAEHSAPEWQA